MTAVNISPGDTPQRIEYMYVRTSAESAVHSVKVAGVMTTGSYKKVLIPLLNMFEPVRPSLAMA